MAKEFFITLNTRELDALRDTDYRVIQGYLYIKRNSNFSEGKTKKICYGALSGYITKIDRTQAKRTVQKLIQLGLLKATDTEQVFDLCFCADTKNDTITSDTLNTSENRNIHHPTSRAREDEEGFSNSGQLKKKTTANKISTTQTTDKGASAPVKAAPQPSFLEGTGEGAESTEAAQIKAHAKAEGWQWCDNPKSLLYYQQTGEASKKLAPSLSLLLAEFQSEESKPTPMGFKIFIDSYNKTHQQNQGQRRGDLVL